MTLKQQQEELKQEIKNIKALLNGSVEHCELACQLLIGHEVLADSSKQELLKGFQDVIRPRSRNVRNIT